MTESCSKTRQGAETAFGNLRTEFFAKNSVVEELASVARSRGAKTFKLQEARLAKEQVDRALATSALLAK